MNSQKLDIARSSYYKIGYRVVSKGGYEITEGQVLTVDVNPIGPEISSSDPEYMDSTLRSYKAHSSKETALIVKAINPYASDTHYDPATKTIAFREFAAIEEELPNKNYTPIIRFANKYGYLTNTAIEKFDPLSR